MRSATLLGSAAVGGLAGAVALSSLELAVLGAMGAAAAVAHAVRAGRSRASHEGLVRFLGGERVRYEDGAVLSPDGQRRVRAAPRSAGSRYEVLSEDGRQTLASYRTLAPSPPLELEALPREVLFARVYGRSVSPVCFDGSPPEIGGSVLRREARWLRLSRFEGGALLERLDDTGECIGDTWHPDVEAARAQIAAELGAHAGPLRSRPPRWDEARGDTWS